MEDFEGDGHNGDGLDPGEEATEQAFKGAILDVSKMKREDGILTKGLSNTQQSVLQRSMTAVTKDTDYRQELKTAFLLSTEESDRVVAAINESDRYGCLRKPIVDWLIARSAGVTGARLHAIFDTISHTTFTTNYMSKNKKHWWSNDKSNDPTRNPLER